VPTAEHTGVDEMTPEAKVKKAVRALLDAEDIYHFNPFGGGYGRAGIPDVICCVNSWFLAIECKAAKGKTTALQARELERIRDAGGVALVVWEDLTELRQAIKELKEIP
jgi:hypothetical protein